MIKASDKVRYAIKNMVLKNDTDNQQMLWWMLWGMMTISERKDWRIISPRVFGFKRICLQRILIFVVIQICLF